MGERGMGRVRAACHFVALGKYCFPHHIRVTVALSPHNFPVGPEQRGPYENS